MPKREEIVFALANIESATSTNYSKYFVKKNGDSESQFFGESPQVLCKEKYQKVGINYSLS